MKRKLLLPSAALILCGIVFGGIVLVSCTEDNTNYKSRPPIYKDLTLNPNPVYTGQKVTGIVSYDDPGAYLMSCDYQYTVSDGTTGTWHQVSPTESQPEFSFYAPFKAGNYDVSFNAPHIRYSANGNLGTLYGSANTVRANLKVLPSAVINANWGDRKDDLMSKIEATDSASLLVWHGNVFLADETSTEMNKDTLQSVRTYHFDNNMLTKVEQTAVRQLTSKSTYNTAMEEYQLDSLVKNDKAVTDVFGLIFANIIYDYSLESNDDRTLIGPAADKYPLSSWMTYNEKKKAELVRAFWRGEIERYEVVLYSDQTKCVASAYMDKANTTGNKNNLVLKWVFTKK
ncbi:MAG: hypothetical protein IKH26_04930 [Bacteroidaceae bacterium]|nr:hypothetical protein [Bacteroidaceae bacterium]